jgi:glycosyltransferase involved in cell wall biosynthesis
VRIVHYLWSAQIGGIERLVLDLADAQKDNGLDVAVLFGRAQGGFIDQYQEREISVSTAGLRGGSDLSPKKLIHLVTFFKPFDLIHLHGFHPLVSLAASLSKRKILYTEHGTFGEGRQITLGDRIIRFFKKLFLNSGVHFITFNSAYTQKKARSFYGLETIPQVIIHNGTNLSNLESSSGDLAPEVIEACRKRFIVGTSSRFTPRKRIDRLIEAFSSFCLDKEVLLLLVGDGPNQQELKILSAELNLTDKVFFTGFKTNITVYQNLMDVCVFPAEKEPFGLVAIEALALGKPTIVFNDGEGLAEIIHHLEPGDVVDTTDELAGRLQYYYSHQNIGQNSIMERKKYVTRFSIERMVEELNKVYDKLN